MNKLPSHPQSLRTARDLARWLGLPATAPRVAIQRAFCRATHYDASLEIETRVPVRRQDEEWEVRIIRARPHCRLELRHARRGAWIRSSAGVPRDVLTFLGARVDRDGMLETRRSWKAWDRATSRSRSWRRLKSRCGEIIALVDIPNVARATGEVRYGLIIDPIGAPRETGARPVHVLLPCPAAEIERVLSEMCDAFRGELVAA